MTINNLRNGSGIASVAQDSPDQCACTPISPNTLTELLIRLRPTAPTGVAMLRTTCAVFSSYLGKSTDELTIQMAFDGKAGFRDFLVSRHYAENSIRTYVNNLRILLKSAVALGWQPSTVVPQAWRPVMDLAKTARSRELVTHLAGKCSTPREANEDEVSRWSQAKISGGVSIFSTAKAAVWLWRVIRNLDLAGDGARISKSHYGIPVSKFPQKLKSEVTELLRWKQAIFSPGRPQDGQHRAVTAKKLERVFTWLYGYATNIQGNIEISSISDLVTESVVNGYVGWQINERQVKGLSVQVGLGMLYAALRHHPSHKTLNLSWFESLLDSVPIEPEAELRNRKSEKYVDYSLLEAIPQLIHKDRIKPKLNAHRVAALAQQELLMKWLITLPWRQRNIRECRIAGLKPNLFKAVIPSISDVTKPAWAIEAQRKDPAATFWQFRFSPTETKTGIQVHSLLPKQLIPLLEEFLALHRPLLLRGNNSNTLFLNEEGGPMSERKLSPMVSELTLRYAGKRTTPHRYRDIVAYAWLHDHPTDFLSLSKLLWHRNINTTIAIYGSRFNESNGSVAMESWLDERAS
jgi:integrase